MQCRERKIKLKDGRECLLRSPGPSDASQMLSFLRETSGETHFMIRYPEEVVLSEDEEEVLLQGSLEDRGSLMIAAFVDRELAGNAGISCINDKIKMRHWCTFGICIKKKYWGLGIGSALIREQMKYAAEIGYEQMELGVFADNERARGLYLINGFSDWGTIKNAFRLKDGTYHDEIQMGRILDRKEKRVI